MGVFNTPLQMHHLTYGMLRQGMPCLYLFRHLTFRSVKPFCGQVQLSLQFNSSTPQLLNSLLHKHKSEAEPAVGVGVSELVGYEWVGDDPVEEEPELYAWAYLVFC